MVEMYLKYKSGYENYEYKKFRPKYNWYEVTDHTEVSNQFSIGNCEYGVWVLYHTETLQAICIGTKGRMKQLAKEMKKYTFDGVDTWKKGGSTIRSLTKLVDNKG
jgi:hypothetical protein